MTKKRNFLRKFWIKITNPVKYCVEYKAMVSTSKNGEAIKSFVQGVDI